MVDYAVLASRLQLDLDELVSYTVIGMSERLLYGSRVI